MGYEFDILRLLTEVIRLLAEHPGETGVLAVLAVIAGVLWKALRFVLGSAADAVLAYFLTERVLKRVSPPDERPGSQEEELTRELGRREAREEALREELRQERRKNERLESGLREARRRESWWRRFLG